MNTAITKKIIINVLENKSLTAEITELLNSIVDKELEKDDNEIDFDLIEECTDVLLSLQLGVDAPASIAFPLVSSHKFLSKVGEIGWNSLSKSVRIILIAAAVFAATVTASAAFGNITGNKIFENLIPTHETTTIVETTAVSTTVNGTTGSVSQTASASNEKASNALRDESEVVCKAQHPQKGYFACYETAGRDEFNPKCHFEKISFNAENVIEYPSSFKETVSNKNTEFDEDEYKRLNCENSVCNEETGELHSFTEWRVIKKPNCTELGEQQRICTVCSATQTCPVKATGEHEYILFSEKRAYMDDNCYLNYKMYDGRIKYKCLNCSDVQFKTVAKAKYIVIDQYEFEYDGKAHRPKFYAVLDRNKKVIPDYQYGVVYNDSGGATDIYNDYGLYAEMRSGHYAQDIEIRFRVIPDTVKLTGVLTGDGTIIPRWEKARFTENVDKAIYEIQYSKNKDFSGAKTVKAYGSAQKTVIKNVEKGATYYVRVRGVADYSRNLTIPKGHWSEVRKIKVR